MLIAAETRNFPSIKEVFQIITTFFITAITRMFFRSPSVAYAFDYLDRMFSRSLSTIPKLNKSMENNNLILFLLFIGVLIVVQIPE